ncbi:MAG: hypothetical protein WAK93_18260 [Solirubrobacteraceae bacterium]
MTRRDRKIRYGAAVALVLIGVVCGASIPGTLGGTLASAFVGLGLIGIVSLIFYEVGLTEDRDRERTDRNRPTARDQSARSRSQSAASNGGPRSAPRARPLDRMRGRRRRLPRD